jgi:uncharacterized protein YqeY
MDDPRSQLQTALKEAMKNKDVARRDTLRMIMSAIKQVEIDQQKDLSPEDVFQVLHKEAKKQRESIDEYRKGGREDLIPREQARLVVIEEFLPQQLSTDEITAIVKEVIAESGAASMKDMGKVMGPVMQRVKGLADGKLVNQIVREQLSA